MLKDILEWLKDNSVYATIIMQILLAIMIHFAIYYSRRNNERKFQEKFNLYKTLVLDRSSQLFIDLYDDFQYFQKFSANKTNLNYQAVLTEIEGRKEKIFVKFCLPIKLYDGNLCNDLENAIESLYTELATKLYVYIISGQNISYLVNETLSQSSNRIIEFLKLGAPTSIKRNKLQFIKIKVAIIFKNLNKLGKILKHLIFVQIT